jgi:hypothetical protein
MGTIVPQVNSAAEARAAINAMKYPPIGYRDYGLGSIVTDLKPRTAQEEVESANRESLVVMTIESRAGVEQSKKSRPSPMLTFCLSDPAIVLVVGGCRTVRQSDILECA